MLYKNGQGKSYAGNEEDFVFVEADAGRIAQVISNLLNNAIKFTKLKVGGGEANDNTITIIVENDDNKSNNSVVVSVKDTGVGIDSEVLPRLFIKFTTKAETGGTGLDYIFPKI